LNVQQGNASRRLLGAGETIHGAGAMSNAMNGGAAARRREERVEGRLLIL
jgi:hypothetical protein